MESIAQFKGFLSRLKHREGTFLIIAAIAIGIVAGLSFLLFHWLINFLSLILVGEETGNAVAGFMRLPVWQQILLPLAGASAGGIIIRFISKESGGAGIGLLLKAIKVTNGKLPPRMTIFKIVTSAISIATGVPLGSEGPIIMIGSAVGSTFGRVFRISISRIKLLVGCGAAAGLSVAFNAPITGTILAVETILGHFAIGTLTPIVVAAATASFFGAYFLPGHEVIPAEALALTPRISSITEIVLFLLFGLMNAVLGVLLIKLTYMNSNIVDKIRGKLPEYLSIPIALLPFALCIPFVPQIFGLGKDMMIMGANLDPWVLIGIALLKLLFLSVAFASGASGGIFFPILFVGYIFGLGFGMLMPEIFPFLPEQIGLSFAAVGIGALLGAATQEPISSLIIVFEITHDYNILPPLMLSAVVSVLISKKLSAFSIYNYQLVKEGIWEEEHEEATIMTENHVEICYDSDPVTAAPGEKILDIVERLREEERFECYVVDDEKKYLGAINGIITSTKEVNYDLINPITIAQDLINTEFPTVGLTDPLSTAMRLMTEFDVIEIPVIAEDSTLLGCIHEHDIIEFYQREIINKASMLKLVQRCECREKQHIQFEDEYTIDGIAASPMMWGKNLIELKLRQNYNILVLAVKEKGKEKSTIAPNRPFTPGDVIITAGRKEDIKSFCRDFKVPMGH